MDIKTEPPIEGFEDIDEEQLTADCINCAKAERIRAKRREKKKRRRRRHSKILRNCPPGERVIKQFDDPVTGETTIRISLLSNGMIAVDYMDAETVAMAQRLTPNPHRLVRRDGKPGERWLFARPGVMEELDKIKEPA